MPAAVLVIDVQHTLAVGRWACADAEGVIARINGVIARARATGVPVIFVQHDEAEGPMVRGSEGWQLAPGLHADAADLRVEKQASDAFHRTTLEASLRERGIDRLVVCGMQSEFCVDSTVRRALALGWPVTLVADGHTTVDNGVLTAAQISANENATLPNLGSYGPRVEAVRAEDVRF